MPNKISVIGAGAWGTTLAILLAENKHDVTLWAYEKETIKELSQLRENKVFLPGTPIPAQVNFTSDINEAAAGRDLLVFVVPAQHLKSAASKIKGLPEKILLLSASKGIEIGSLKRPSQILEEHFKKAVSVLSGPNLAGEISRGLPAASVVASTNKAAAKKIQEIMMSERFRVYTQDDVCGVELGGALKNIIAIAAGIIDGLKLGENARAGLMVRGISEISRLGEALGAEEKTFYGLSGIGDLILTCSSASSRNHRVGMAISRGKKLKEITEGTKEVAEGITTCKAVNALAKKLKIDMPISSEIFAVLFEEKDPYLAISQLLTRRAKAE